MKKLLAVFLTLALVFPAGLISISAADTSASSTEVKVSGGCSYTYTGQYYDKQSGRYLYPDSATTPKLTDGEIGTRSDVGYASLVWVGINYRGENTTTIGRNSITLDLGEQKSKLSKFRLYALSYLDAGIGVPANISVSVSNDNIEYYYVGNTVLYEKVVDSPSGYEDYGIYVFTLSLSEAYSARYVEFSLEHNYAWIFVSEIEVYQNPDLPDAPVVRSSLLSLNASDWKSGPAQGGETASASIAYNMVIISGSSSSSPYVYYDIASPATVDIDNYYLVYDFTVSGGETNIVLYCEGSTAESGTNAVSNITHLIADAGSRSGDNLKAGTYTGKIKLSDLNLSNVSLKEAGKLSISAVKIYSINGGVITLRKLEIEQSMPELDNNGYDSQGIGYFIDEEFQSAYVSTAVDTISGSITLPSKVKYNGVIYPVIGILSHAFLECDDLTEVTIPEGFIILGPDAFAYCSSLRKINLPASLAFIVMNPFYECPALAEIVIDANNQNYLSENNVIFNKDKTELVVYPAGKTDAEYTIPRSVTAISDYAFYSAAYLQKVNIPSGVTSIGSSAFAYSGLTAVSLPDGVDTLFDETFYNCTDLVSVRLPKSLSYIGFNCFTNCYSLVSIEIDEDNECYSTEDDILFSKFGDELILYPAGKTVTSYTIPDGVQTIGISAFAATRIFRA